MDNKPENNNYIELTLEEFIGKVITEIYKTLKAENLLDTKTFNTTNTSDFPQSDKGTDEIGLAPVRDTTIVQNAEHTSYSTVDDNPYIDSYGTMEGSLLNSDLTNIKEPVAANYTGRYYSNMRKYYIHWKKIK
ncbi:hypothetical protein [Petroclostridium sp. X23]|uniref:hypothetical protein n=1 Tax=Petroclostridium sp. X23 TaxID=3045146 RepID=UPI0024AD7650|nr:hypothetical protein [Petroclostridium sp. X23]WHH56939.1 hypothetical protein QKW49_13885 [Petroclostridium sp. X23]